MDLHILSSPEYEKVVCGCQLHVCMYGYVPCCCLNGWTDFIHINYLRVPSAIGRCLMNMNILAPKIGALQMGTKTQNDIFLKTRSNNFD
jgi:hypothetical protein